MNLKRDAMLSEIGGLTIAEALVIVIILVLLVIA